MMFLDRGRRSGPGRFTRLKVHLFFAGAAVLLAGMALKRDALVLLAIAVLAAGFLLRFLDRAPDDADEAVEEEDLPESDPPPPPADADRHTG